MGTKLTKESLKQMIKEELGRVLNETDYENYKQCAEYLSNPDATRTGKRIEQNHAESKVAPFGRDNGKYFLGVYAKAYCDTIAKGGTGMQGRMNAKKAYLTAKDKYNREN